MDQQSTQIDIASINEKVAQESQFVEVLVNEMNKVIVGQQYMIERLLIGLLGRGHILLEGVPGLAKTLAITTLSKRLFFKNSVYTRFASSRCGWDIDLQYEGWRIQYQERTHFCQFCSCR
jgi:DNA polymerase III delta prime subunit